MHGMGKYQKITESREVLNLSESATMQEIKANYRALLGKWHPDKSAEDKDLSNEMTRRVIAAYQTIVAYCKQYRFSFSEEEVKKYISPEEWWFERFGNDPLWGKDAKSR
jgi:DnaJ-class molecular chaperone